MKEGEHPGQTKAQKKAYLYDLSVQILREKEGAQKAGARLSEMVEIGDLDALELVHIMKSVAGDINPELSQPPQSSLSSRLRTSLVTFLRTAFRGMSEGSWSKADQERLTRGGFPVESPRHTDIWET